ncbi:MAG: hypothetical protein EA396_01145 [Anaerolineaceae bacterium]|nr:MAG: hypothetical protein EA396_01145 [Anaerolineaceae bacterium]
MYKYPAIIAFVILLALSACSPYLNTADQVDIRRVNHALERFNQLDSFTTQLEGHIEQDLRVSFARQSESMTSDMQISGTGRSQRNAGGSFDIDMQMTMALDIREDRNTMRGDVSFEMVMIGTGIYMRMNEEAGLTEAGLIDAPLGQWVFVDFDQMTTLLPAEALEMVDSFTYDGLTEYPITANTVRSISRPSPITSGGAQLRGYRFDLDMLAVLDEIGLADIDQMFAELLMLDDLSGFDEMGGLSAFGGMLPQMERLIRDMYEDTTVTITAWLDENDTLRRLDTDITMRYDIEMMGVRMQMTQSSRETATYADFNQPMTIVAPF